MRRLLYWLLVLTVLFVGAGLLGSDDPAKQTAGVALLVAPTLLFIALSLLHYARERSKARR